MGQLALTDLRLRYRGMSLGLWWSLVFPLVQVCIYYFAFARVLQVQSVPRFPLFLALGVFHWVLLSGVVTQSPRLIVANAGLIDKIAFPRVAIPLASVTAALVQHGLAMAALAVLWPLLHGTLWWGDVLYIPILALAATFAAGAAMLLSSLTVFLRDLEQLTALAMAALFFLSPVVYDFHLLPYGLQQMLALNPFHAYLDGMRSVLFWERLPAAGTWALMVAWAMVALFGGGAVFRRLESRFAEAL